MKYDVQDILVRALKTFIQAFLASVVVANVTDLDTLKAAVIGGIAAGIAAVWNTLILLNDIRKS